MYNSLVWQSYHSIRPIYLNSEDNVELLERRRKLQLLGIMWKRAHGGEVIEQVNARTRGDLKIRFGKGRAKTSFY